MRDNTIPTDELNQLPREMLVILYTNLSESFRILSEQNGMIQKQNEQLISQVEDLKEQLAILTQHRFGPRSERNLQTEGQLSIDLENMCVLNEAECLVEEGLPEEAAMEAVLGRRKPRAKGKRALNLKDIETVIVIHECPEEELAGQFPRGWHALPDEVYKELKYVPGRFEVHEHHVRVYAGDHDTGGILRAPGPARLLDHSILTPELAAAIFNAKYVNAVPLKRLSEEFLRNDVSIPRQDMAGWMIRLHEYYLGPVHERMREELLKSHHLHCDEKKGLDQSSKLVGALNYSVNQEQFLRVFLEDGAIPPDNNDAERSIRSFCVGKHNWKIIDSKKGRKPAPCCTAWPKQRKRMA